MVQWSVNVGVTFTARSFFRDKINLRDTALMLGRMNQASVLRTCAQPEPRTLEEALFGPLPLWVCPVLHDGTEFYISSRGWLFNKLLRGFETTPFRQPIVQPFEAALSAKLGRNVFAESNDVGPLQLFDVETLESWDEFFSLPAETSQLFALLRQRAESVVHRYSSFERMCRPSSSRTAASLGILEQATTKATEIILAKANEISAQIPLPEHLQPFGSQLRTVGGPWKRKQT